MNALNPLVSAEGISKSFGQRTLWQDLSFSVNSGEILAIQGQSGCGKTTLLHCLAGFEPFQGDITVAGIPMNGIRGAQRTAYLRDTVGLLFQNFGLVDDWTAERNLDVVRREPKTSFVPRTHQALEGVGLSRDVLAQPTHLLSGGEQQRLALARLILKRAKVILADEPTSALDDDNSHLLMDRLLAMARKGAAVIIVTHDPRVWLRCSKRLALTDLGEEDRPRRAAV